MAMIKCPECGKNVSDKAEKCVECGYPIYLYVSSKVEKIKCSYCGTMNEAYNKDCVMCGASLVEIDGFKQNKEDDEKAYVKMHVNGDVDIQETLEDNKIEPNYEHTILTREEGIMQNFPWQASVVIIILLACFIYLIVN